MSFGDAVEGEAESCAEREVAYGDFECACLVPPGMRIKHLVCFALWRAGARFEPVVDAQPYIQFAELEALQLRRVVHHHYQLVVRAPRVQRTLRTSTLLYTTPAPPECDMAHIKGAHWCTTSYGGIVGVLPYSGRTRAELVRGGMDGP